MTSDKYYFISDIHLGSGSKEDEKEKEDILLRFLDEIKNDAKEIFIVGDLFDCWIEYRQVVPKGHYRILNKLYEISEKGIKISYFAGNHDFWKGSYFKDEFEIDILHNPIERTIEGKKFYISHGDGLAYKDTGYKILKKILRNRVSQFFYSLIHPDIGIWLAKKTSASSRDYTDNKDYSEKDGMRDFAIRKLNDGYEFVILGHRHKPFIKDMGKGTYINIGDWIKHFSYGLYQNGKFTLARFFDKKEKRYLKISEGEINQ